MFPVASCIVIKELESESLKTSTNSNKVSNLCALKHQQQTDKHRSIFRDLLQPQSQQPGRLKNERKGEKEYQEI